MAEGIAILDAVCEACPSGYFDRKLGVQRNSRLRSTVCHPAEALQSLRRRFADENLVAAGIVRSDSFGELQLVPALCQPGGVIVVLRKSPAEPPFDLLTGRGSLVKARHPVLSALEDSRRKTLAAETGMMLVTPRNWTVALLDLLDLPATHGWGLSRLGFKECQELNSSYGDGIPEFTVTTEDDVPEESEGIDDQMNALWDPPSSDTSTALRPMLILMDRFDERAGSEPSHWLLATARHLATLRRYAGLSFAGVWVWRPDAEFETRLQFAFQSSDRNQMRQVVLQGLTSVVDFESVLESPAERRDAAPGFLQARRELIGQLTADPTERPEYHVDDANEIYDAAVQRELVEPLITWALASSHPVIRAAGVQLAEVVAQLHRVAPRLHALQSHRIACSNDPGGASLQSELLAQYSRFVDRCSRLCGELSRWKI